MGQTGRPHCQAEKGPCRHGVVCFRTRNGQGEEPAISSPTTAQTAKLFPWLALCAGAQGCVTVSEAAAPWAGPRAGLRRRGRGRGQGRGRGHGRGRGAVSLPPSSAKMTELRLRRGGKHACERKLYGPEKV